MRPLHYATWQLISSSVTCIITLFLIGLFQAWALCITPRGSQSAHFYVYYNPVSDWFVPGMRPLHYAAWQGHEGPVKLLLNGKSCPNNPCTQGVTPLHLAGEHGHVSVVGHVIYVTYSISYIGHIMIIYPLHITLYCIMEHPRHDR